MAYIGQNADGNFTTSVSKDTFSGNGSTTAFTLSEGATTNTVDVFVENIRQEPTTAYTVDGTTLTFTAAPVTGTNNIYVVNRGPIQLSASHPAAQALTAHSATITTDLTVDTNTLYVDSTNNRVGIGTTSADEVLEVSGDIKSSGSNFGIYHFGETSDVTKIVGRDAGHASFPNIMDFFTNSTLRMRIDSSGRLLVGKTTNAIGTAGHTLQADGFFSATRSAAYVAGFNRLSDNGQIVQFFKDGTAVGSIGTSGQVYIAGTSHALKFFSLGIQPADTSGANTDNSMDIGASSTRFNDAFIANGVTTTSDQNEKQDIASLTDAEINAAKEISKLFKTFKWKDRVTAKGDAARTHAGVIAQEVQSAITDAGLDATKYAFWCSDTWWETQTQVPAVEADEENGIEAQDAYTRTDTYDTADEAPEGATERTRLGIRYPELLAFVGAATEQRLADIETRLTALESA